jgi:hypothetical protein
MHRAAYHFIRALGVPSMAKIKGRLSQKKGKKKAAESNDANEDDNEDENERELENREEPNEDEDEEDVEDVDVSMDVEADADDLEAMAAITVTNYDPGDTLGKLMAFVNQLRMSSELTRDYLGRMCIMQNLKPIELLLWIRTRWGSLTHCLEATLSVQKVCYCFYGLFRDTHVYTRL